jgi:hypothetical protein
MVAIGFNNPNSDNIYFRMCFSRSSYEHYGSDLKLLEACRSYGRIVEKNAVAKLEAPTIKVPDS